MNEKVLKKEDLLCNKCGNLCNKPSPDKDLDFTDHYGLNNAVFFTGYFSESFADLSQIKFSFCEECLFEIFTVCKVKPKIRDVDLYGHPRDINGNPCEEFRDIELVGKKFQ